MSLLGKIDNKNDWTTICAPDVPQLKELVTGKYKIASADFDSAIEDPEKYCNAEGSTCLDYRAFNNQFAIPVRGEKAMYRANWPTGKNATNRFPF
jgi:hypothetical protein